MPKNLITEWKRIGRSGATVDGRIIEASALEQAAKNYKKGLFTALIWPDHIRWFNMGTVEALRTEKNSEQGIDLFAKIAPNDIYLSTNKAGQRLFTSVELTPNFRDTGEYYLTGLAATDNPASAATSEMRFSAINNTNALIADFIENIPQTFTDDQPPSWFKKMFNQNNGDLMSNKQLNEIFEKLSNLEKRFAQINTDKPTDNTANDQYADLNKKVEKLSKNLKKITEQLDNNSSDPSQFTQLSKELKKLRKEFTAAVNETDGTDAGDHLGDGEKLEDYI